MASAVPTVVAFDLMDTLVHDPWREALGAAFGDDLPSAIEGRDPDAWPRFERGEVDEATFWSTFSGFVPDVDRARAVRRAQTTWLPGMRKLVLDVRATGCGTVLASNYPAWFDDVAADLLTDEFDATVVSCRVGVRKPDAEFFDHVATAAGRAHQEIVFVDDRQANVDGAVATGMRGLVFTDAAAARRDLRERGLAV